MVTMFSSFPISVLIPWGLADLGGTAPVKPVNS